jgi:hypothetical protein
MTIRTIIIAFIALTFSACANRQSVSVASTTNMQSLKTIYVVHQPKDKNQINQLIAENLRYRGVTATTDASSSPSNVDAVITYIDRWMWDITMYLLQLTVTVSDPKTNAQIATATSLHGSLTRLSPVEMVNETLGNIYNGKVAEEK